MRVFVYGALMADERLVGQAGIVRDHALRFTARGLAVLEPRFLALEPSAGDDAHGLVAEVDSETWAQLTAHEEGYVEEDVEVEMDGERVVARALLLTSSERADEALPSGRYADLLVRGAIRTGLPEPIIAQYREAARRGPPFTRWMRPWIWTLRFMAPYTGFLGAAALTLTGLILALLGIAFLLLWIARALPM